MYKHIYSMLYVYIYTRELCISIHKVYYIYTRELCISIYIVCYMYTYIPENYV